MIKLLFIVATLIVALTILFVTIDKETYILFTVLPLLFIAACISQNL